jgi:hypothetical protein
MQYTTGDYSGAIVLKNSGILMQNTLGDYSSLGLTTKNTLILMRCHRRLLGRKVTQNTLVLAKRHRRLLEAQVTTQEHPNSLTGEHGDYSAC